MESTVNGLRLIAHPGQDRMSQRKILRVCAASVATVQELDFSKCAPLICSVVADVGENGGARWIHRDGEFFLEVERYVDIEDWRVGKLMAFLAFKARHEIFHHYDATSLTEDQRNELFCVSHQVEPNGFVVANGLKHPVWRDDPNDNTNWKWWIRAQAYDRAAGEDFAYLCQDIYDGEDDGLRDVHRPNFKGRKKQAALAYRAILED